MPVIGYQQQYTKVIVIEKWRAKERWLLVDTTGSRGYIRFDNRGNYGKRLG